MDLSSIRNLSQRSKVIAASGILVLAGFAGGATVAVTSSASADETSQGARDGGHGNEEPLTGDTADQVTAAVEAEYPGATILRVETDSDGAYEAHVVTADGQELEVALDEDFAITGAEEHGFGHGGFPGGPGGGRGEQPLTGDTADQVRAAVDAEYPNATIERLETDAEGVYEAHVVTADGEPLVVAVDEDFNVTGTSSIGGDHADDDAGSGADDTALSS